MSHRKSILESNVLNSSPAAVSGRYFSKIKSPEFEQHQAFMDVVVVMCLPQKFDSTIGKPNAAEKQLSKIHC
jgi:hypothetical protein